MKKAIFVFSMLFIVGCSKEPSVADLLKDRELRKQVGTECESATQEKCKNLVKALDLLQSSALFGVESTPELLEYVSSIDEIEQ